MTGAPGASAAPGLRAATAGTRTVLIYGPTLASQTPNEQTIATAAGFSVTVATESEWSAMTTADFSSYDAIVFGDPVTVNDPSPLGTADATKATWSPAVAGPMVVNGTNAIGHGNDAALRLTRESIEFAASASSTGLYATLSTFYSSSPSNTPVAFLSDIGTFTVENANTNTAFIVDPDHPVVQGVTSSSLSNWSSSIHETFNSFPSEFDEIVRDQASGRPYVIATPIGLMTTKNADTPATPTGGRNGYTITIKNRLPTTAQIDSITDTLPDGFTYVAGSSTRVTTADPAISGQTLTWSGPFSVSSGNTINLHFRVIVATAPGEYLNTAGGTAQGAKVTPTGPTAPVTVIGEADLSVSTGDASGRVGRRVVHAISVGNGGPDPATATTLSAAFAPGEIVLGASPSQGTCTWSDHGVSCDLGAVGVGGATVRVTSTPVQSGPLPVDAQVTATTNDPDSSNDLDSGLTTATGQSCTMVGTSGPDTLTGSGGADVLCGLTGADTMDGAGGDDVLYGGGGHDVLTGGSGSDVLTGDAGPDDLHADDGVSGNDTAYGGANTDTCSADPGDVVTGCP